ncbi:hypothetical protein B0H11DRAFT_2008683 [Mycena galericulata]|nr:hypothetical protein B0H11DRAFT_2008683 [Mycena galericulata]
MSGATCLALLPVHNHRCSDPPKAGYPWCPFHHGAERRHHNTYKYHSDALDNFDNSTVCTDVESIMDCDSLENLRLWATGLRKKLNLCEKVIQGRRYHHDRFHSGGDSNHLFYISVLLDRHMETEAALLAVNQRHDELSGLTSSDSEDLDEEEVTAIIGWKNSSAGEATEREDPYADRFEEDRRRERALLIDRFLAFRKAALLHGPDTAEPFTDYMERLLILAIRERSGMRTLLYTGATDVEAFLEQDIVTLDELKQIYVAVHLMPPQTVLRAINDAFRSVEETHDVILGRRIYRDAWSGEICLAAWDLFEDVIPCRHCALQGCYRLEEWTQIERLTTLSLRFLSWQPEGAASFSGADTLFHLSGVFAERKWERHHPKPYRQPKNTGWAQTERPAGLYLKFPFANKDLYHQFLATIQTHPHVFSVLPWAPAFTDKSGALIPKAATELCASRIRTAPTAEDLPDAPWRDHQAVTEREARKQQETSRDPAVLHMIVLDRTSSELPKLKDNLAAALLYSQQVSARTPDVFVAGEMRELLDAGCAGTHFGEEGEGLLGIACGAIEVRGESFRLFRQRCVALVEALADTSAVVRWGRKTREQKRKDAVACWMKWRQRLDRMLCSKDFFYLGTEEGHTHLRERLGRTISPTEGAMVKYDEDVSREVFRRALDRSEAVEKMLPPRQIPMDWDGEIRYPAEMTDGFSFMHEVLAEATIVEVDDELSARLEEEEE